MPATKPVFCPECRVSHLIGGCMICPACAAFKLCYAHLAAQQSDSEPAQ